MILMLMLVRLMSQPVRLELRLEEALDRALEASARLEEQAALEEAALYGTKRARADRLPDVRLSLSYTRNSEVPEFGVPGLPGQGILFPSIENNYRSRIGLSVPLYTGGRLDSQVDAAENEHQAAGSDRAGARADLLLETIAAYWNLFRLLESERVLARGVSSLEAHRVDAENRRRVGLVAVNEVLAVDVEKERAELNRLRAQNGGSVAAANLCRLLGLSPETELVLTEPIDRPAVKPEEAAGLVARALENRPERRALLERLAAARARAAAARGDWFPAVALSGGYDYNNPNLKVLPPREAWRSTWDVGVSLSWSVFDSGRRQADEGRARAQADALQKRLEDADARIALDVRARRLDLLLEQEAIRVGEKAFASAEENQRVARERYRAGLIPSSELLDAEIVLLRAGLERTEAGVGARTAEAALDRAVGAVRKD